MKKKKIKFWKTLGNLVCAVAVFSVCTGYSHCLLIIHQPPIPEELKSYRD